MTTDEITLTTERNSILGIICYPRKYITTIWVNGISSSLRGVATTPTEAQRQARLKLRLLGNKSNRNRLAGMCIISPDKGV